MCNAPVANQAYPGRTVVSREVKGLKTMAVYKVSCGVWISAQDLLREVKQSFKVDDRPPL